MRRERPILFRRRHFEAEIIVLCVRWYLRYPLSFRQLEEMMAERSLSAGPDIPILEQANAEYARLL